MSIVSLRIKPLLVIQQCLPDTDQKVTHFRIVSDAVAVIINGCQLKILGKYFSIISKGSKEFYRRVFEQSTMAYCLKVGLKWYGACFVSRHFYRRST